MVDRTTRIGSRESRFPSTQWSLVLAAKHAEPASYRDHLEALIRIYWKPVYTYIRRRWHKSNEDAKDLAQGFFADLLTRPFLSKVGPELGRFRTFVRACLESFLSKRYDADRALKRGGGAAVESLSFIDANVAVPADGDPDAAFERAWKDAVLAEAVAQLRDEYARENRRAYFDVFEALQLKAGDKASYADVAARLDLTVTDVTNFLSRARARFKAIVRRLVRNSVGTEEDFREEMKRLFGEG